MVAKQFYFKLFLIIALTTLLLFCLLTHTEYLLRPAHQYLAYQNYSFRLLPMTVTTGTAKWYQNYSSRLLPMTVKTGTAKWYQNDSSRLLPTTVKPAEGLRLVLPPSFPTTKDVLPRSAYFDDRAHGNHKNATVILFEATKAVLRDKLVVGCGIESKKASTNFKIINMMYGPWIRKKSFYPALTHQQGIAFCYDLPVQNGSRTFLVYRHKTSKSNTTDRDTLVYTERPLHIEPRDTSQSNRILVCTTIFGRPPWFTAWLRYQKTIGVDFVHLYAQESFVEEGGMDNPQLREFIKQGFVKVDIWKAYLNDTELFYHSEILLYQDCVLRYLNVFEYVFLYDTDDFFIPRMSHSSNISNYIKRFFNNKRVGSVQLEWPRYFADCGLTGEPDDIRDGNITKILSSHKHSRDYIKSINRLSAILEVGVHEPTSMMPGYRLKRIVNSTAYVAHIRKHTKRLIC